MPTTTAMLPEGRQRYYNNDGTPCAGGKLYTYAANTSNPKAAYTDADGNVAHPNPITLDAHGEAVVYWSGAYKVDLRQADGQQVTGYPVDNLKTDPAGLWGLASTLTTSAGAAMLGFLQAGAGAVLRTIRAKLFEIASVKDYGAVGDGATDDTAAIKRAIAAARTVLFPDGQYLVSDDIVLRSNQMLDFQGNAALLAGANDISLLKAVTQTGIVLNSPSVLNNGKTGVVGIHYNAIQTGCRIEKPNLVGGFKQGIWFESNVYGVTINQPLAFQCPNPVEFGYSCNANSIISPEFNNLTDIGGTGTGVGINFNSPDAGTNVVMGGYIQGLTDGYIDKGSTNSLRGTYFEKCTNSHIFLNGAVHAKISDTFHYGQLSTACIAARNTKACTVKLPSMVAGNVTVGLFDVDNSNTNFKAELNNSAGYNVPLGGTAGVSFLQEDGGTFAAYISGSTGAGACNYLFNKFNFKRNGNICYVQGAVVWEAHTGTGDFQFNGFPYVADSTLGMFNVNYSGPVVSADMVTASFVTADPKMVLQKVLNGALSNLPMAPGGTLQISGFYFIKTPGT